MASALVLTPVATDNFLRANGTIAGSNNWLATSDGSMAISSNEAIGTTAAIRGDFRTSETYNSDQYSQIVIGSVNNIAGSFVGPAVRCQSDTSSCYVAVFFADGTPPHINLYKRTAPGAFTLLADHKMPIGTISAGDTLTLIAEGSQLTIQVNGVGAFTLIDTSIPSGGTPGITSFHAITLDNWVGGNASTPALPAAAATDGFVRANGGMSSGQSVWAIMTGYPAVDIPIVSNELNVTTGSHAADARTDAFPADQWSSVIRGSVDVNATGFVGLVLRVNAGLNSGYLGCYFGHAENISNASNANSSYRIYRLDTGTSTLLAACGSKADNGATFNPAGTKYTFVVEGTRLSFRVNDKEVLATTDTTYTTGEPGIMNFPTATADNWSGGAVAAGTTPAAITATAFATAQASGLVRGGGFPNAVNTQQIGIGGASPTYSPATVAGDEFRPDARTLVHVKNGSGASITVTIPAYGSGPGGNPVANRTVSVPAGGERVIGPFDPSGFSAPDGLAMLLYSAVTSVTVAVLKI